MIGADVLHVERVDAGLEARLARPRHVFIEAQDEFGPETVGQIVDVPAGRVAGRPPLARRHDSRYDAAITQRQPLPFDIEQHGRAACKGRVCQYVYITVVYVSVTQ